MSTSKKLFLTMFFNVISLIFIISVSFFIAKKNIEILINKDLESVGLSVFNLSSFYAKNNPKGYENKEFKDAIKEIKIGKSGYIYFVDESGKIIIHPTIEGKNLASLDFIQKIINSNDKSGIVEYYTDVTDQDKIIYYKYIPEWKMWVVPGINKEDYVKDIYVEFFYKIVLLGAFIIILQLIIFYLITRGITKQIKDFSSHFREFLSFITYKQNRIEKKKLEGNCEFSVMTKDINSAIDEFDDKFKHDMRVIGESVLTFDKLKKGIFKCRVNSNSSNPMINTLKNTINDALDDLENYMREIEKTLISYTSNDYKDRIVINNKIANPSRLLKVIQSVNSLGDTLATQAKNSLENGSSLETNSKTLKNSIENLTSKITKQIESLEETTLAVEKISEITNNNSKNTTSMSKLAEIVKQAVEDGYNLSNKTTKSMDDINEKVIAINEAITIIDQIAFQTNILSLNAAVEAATAGEAGKGFAVVAGEVRNLANKSAEAANEIKKLVEIANQKAHEGKDISNEMQNGYKNLHTHITETLQIIQNVSDAANEQMVGINQVSQTIVSLDQISKDNQKETNLINDISNVVSSMAIEVLEDAKNKKF
ncbi:methyl-accepting chemotaxis protein [Arcobacter cryaerophilus gv. pseudocryaerophilus]|uniref:Methyl-accepting chemotaxis protein n=6 Tax=Arcobacteraceae TaxID=2808963 RepID=A0AA96R9Y0_9BACT|nr:methyl-accepting chemotaxis protein [Arcobacter sp. AZ-2023]WPD05341.1 methyl-accepting chemotaxis protein [Arcobacter sp. DSM 115956]WPD07435.1 methyl-accepting chemotaxis protein [Arcobacter sp. DSM 115955]WNL31701.1 methyl-accepting chemotaxis protein [Arcobacter sp. AZ-2023]WNP37851.1 methyl-accepting chemotaxis protein [Arcobacter sp. AZ-2023]